MWPQIIPTVETLLPSRFQPHHVVVVGAPIWALGHIASLLWDSIRHRLCAKRALCLPNHSIFVRGLSRPEADLLSPRMDISPNWSFLPTVQGKNRWESTCASLPPQNLFAPSWLFGCRRILKRLLIRLTWAPWNFSDAFLGRVYAREMFGPPHKKIVLRSMMAAISTARRPNAPPPPLDLPSARHPLGCVGAPKV